jgi:8-oxo-dGTP pyrophosphatase MutT (NUDIX family)
VILPLRGLDLRYEPLPWAFTTARRAEIAAHWTRLTEANPQLWNGEVLVQHRWRVEDGIYRAGDMPVDYASFLAWRDFGWPDPPVRNGFGMAALRTSDGAFVLGVMADHTANAGKVYFAGGTPDMHDVTIDNRVDLAGSLVRELQEETGLCADEVTLGDDWTAAIDGTRVAFLKPARLAMPAETARALIRARLPGLAEQELSDIVIVRGPGEIDPARMPGFAAEYMAAVFAAEGRGS